jgi:uncharacterized protein (TIGR03435 family)
VAGSGAAQSTPRTATGPGFDRATVRAANRREPVDIEFFPGRFAATNVTLELLIEQAYEIEPNDLVGGPDWVRDGDRFDIDGATGFAAGNSDMLRMLRVLLADRFKLQMAQEPRNATAYTLAAGDGHGLKAPRSSGDRPRVATTHQGRGGSESFTSIGQNATLAMLADDLSDRLQLPVSDKTGLRDSYDFTVTYSLDATALAAAFDRDLGVHVMAGAADVDRWVIRAATRPRIDK